MKRVRALRALILLSVIHGGCATIHVFHLNTLENVDRTITFAALKPHPNAYQGVKLELGWQIVGFKADQHQVRMLVRELPIKTHSVYGPVDIGTLRGMFVVMYPGSFTDQDLQHGNMVVVVGTVIGAVTDALSGSPVVRPAIQAQCIHIWRTGGAAIEDFPWPPFLQGYSPLVQQTYCANEDNTFLTTS